ncbi:MULTISPECIES: monooxygenase [Micromonospora]|uniref:Monooxygenase n=1 Tax=Micromonospora solifontis TaxID=2487138 RepID=A0ABX9WDN6_9ACTN|nr:MULTISPECIES: monooxygenase [Micromonospora]NES12293.1 monooxygenase [Micromonospora sp. PPF5-17B]NES37855.1 monooxygenase [Micromonospora solifontis]NES54224.1 monooxygenase [Micromonospora sp. PPF5-6]RNL97863.1 monooxygenase [Micromonospora solifontis]
MSERPVRPSSEVPDLVTLHVWRIRRTAVPGALRRMAAHPWRLRRLPGVRFAKLLGTGTGTGFGPGDADPTRWAALVVWDSPAAAAGFDASPVGRSWARIARATARVELRPLTSRGEWSGRRPFGEPSGGRVDGPVLALTRARLRTRRAATFWRAVPPVAAALHTAPGLLARFGVGEAPLGWQGTVSVWRDPADLVAFAYRHPEHRAAITRTPTEGWYAEELFARFAVRDVVGDPTVLGWAVEGDPDTARGHG